MSCDRYIDSSIRIDHDFPIRNSPSRDRAIWLRWDTHSSVITSTCSTSETVHYIWTRLAKCYEDLCTKINHRSSVVPLAIAVCEDVQNQALSKGFGWIWKKRVAMSIHSSMCVSTNQGTNHTSTLYQSYIIR